MSMYATEVFNFGIRGLGVRLGFPPRAETPLPGEWREP